jgi:hypothetical protein
MEPSDRTERVRTVVSRLRNPSRPEDERLAEAWAEQVWPGGGEDRREPGAVEWVRSWGPVRLGAAVFVCGCAERACSVCN